MPRSRLKIFAFLETFVATRKRDISDWLAALPALVSQTGAGVLCLFAIRTRLAGPMVDRFCRFVLDCRADGPQKQRIIWKFIEANFDKEADCLVFAFSPNHL